MKILLVDNYDSFTFNLKHLIESCGAVELNVRRNDEDFLGNVARGDYAGAIIGPGPGSPDDERYFGHNKALILEYGTRGLPILGVCLGFQGIYHLFGGRLAYSTPPMHGKTSGLDIVGDSVLLRGIAPGTRVMRYHSIVADTAAGVPDDIRITAYAHDDTAAGKREAMALEHRRHPIHGVQFHPESFATRDGRTFIRNFLDICDRA